MILTIYAGAGSAEAARKPVKGRIGRPRMSGGPQQRRDGKLQAEVVAALAQHIPALETGRWKKRTIEAFSKTKDVEHVEEDFRGFISEFGYIPDGFVINKEEMRLDFFEAEITSLMTDSKLQAYGEFATVMDYYGIEFTLFTVNQHGHINEVLLLQHYLDWLAAQQTAASLLHSHKTKEQDK